MSRDDLDERLRAVERAMTDGDAAVSDLSEAAAVHDRLDDVEAELADLAERLDALDATVQSLHGYVGDLEAVNERVQRRADAAREAVERLEAEQRRPPQRTPNAERADATASADSADATGTAATADTATHRDETTADAERFEAETEDDSLLDRVRESL
ncbi:uncharacterized protein HHUB_1420 [Halobacterium hubeiense]|uniref:DUF7310 domain-containing protein n=1 Tax=Halobacterium hubeiense TaxID=1407499 RepID=A0A0U5GYX2_9EURY|nr:hypothetical protein [Halobacterium hubeiense]CQH48465.1 uncharacterized protein HHUB_1420 [Halobacterium hubeiense]